MTTYSTIAGLPLPENTDGLVAEQAFGQYAQSLDNLIVPQYASTTARDAAMASGKIEGQFCTVAGELQFWDGQGWWNQGNTRYVIKTADTSRASTVTPTADPHLVVTLPSAGTWMLEAWLGFATSVAATNCITTWTDTGNFTNGILRTVYGVTPGAVNNTIRQVAMGGTSTSTAFTTSAINTNFAYSLRWETLVLTTTASTVVSLNWAQGTTNATALLLKTGSHITYRKV